MLSLNRSEHRLTRSRQHEPITICSFALASDKYLHQEAHTSGSEGIQIAATFQWCQDTGAATGSPAKGTTRNGFGADSNYPTNTDWKSVDDTTTAYSSAPITAGQNSYIKYMYGRFTGTFTAISNCKWGHSAGTLGTGLTLVGKVTSTYATPATTAMSGSTNMTSVIDVPTAGQSVSFSTTGPEAASPTSTLSAAGYTQYLASQLQVASNAAAGDTASVTLQVTYDET